VFPDNKSAQSFQSFQETPAPTAGKEIIPSKGSVGTETSQVSKKNESRIKTSNVPKTPVASSNPVTREPSNSLASLTTITTLPTISTTGPATIAENQATTEPPILPSQSSRDLDSSLHDSNSLAESSTVLEEQQGGGGDASGHAIEEHKANSESENDEESDDEDGSSGSSDSDDDDDDEDSSDSGESSDDSSSEESKDEQAKPIKKAKLPTINETDEEEMKRKSPQKPQSPSLPSVSQPASSLPKKANKENIFNRFLGSFLYKNQSSSTSSAGRGGGPKSAFAKQKQKKINLLSKFFPRGRSEGTGNVSFQDDIFESKSDSSSVSSSTSPSSHRQTHQQSTSFKRSNRGSLKLPKMIYTEPIDGKEFQSKVNKLATEEANLVSRLEFLGVPVAEECRVYTTRGYSLDDLKEIGQVPLWLQQHEKIGGTSLSSPVGVTPDQVHLTEGDKEDLLRDGRYGPRADGLDMTLPVNYPSSAGLAIDALGNNLKKDRKAKEIIEKNRVPSVAEVLIKKEAAEKRVWIPTPKWIQERQRRKEKRKQIEVEVGMNLMLTSGYPASRRQSLVTLPGMTSHYPNPSYEMPAKLPPQFVPKPIPQKFLGNFFSKKKNKLEIQISESVGRKPLELSSQYQSYLKSLKEEEKKKLQQKEEEDRLIALLENPELGEEKEGKSGEGAAASLSGVESEIGSMVGSIEPSQDNGQDQERSLRSLGAAEDQSLNTLKTKQTNKSSQPVASSLALSLQSKKTAAAPSSISASLTGSVVAVTKKREEDSLALASFAEERKQTSSLFATSKDIYLERRGSFLVAPGLESFSKHLEEKKNPLKKVQFDDYGRSLSSLKRSVSVGGTVTMTQQGETITPRKVIQAPGLIRVMNTNVSFTSGASLIH
jgi:hypothetical protein